MIKILNHRELIVSEKIRLIFQASYAIEAALLNATNFPPLERELDDFMTSTTQFFGYHKEDEIAAVIEIHTTESTIHIQSLVVEPKFFRQGIAGKLMEFVLNSDDFKLFMVETGLENDPAVKLYKKYNFNEVLQWDTDHGVRKVRLEKRPIGIES